MYHPLQQSSNLSKSTVCSRILQLRISSLVISIVAIITVVQFFITFGQFNYDCVPYDSISDELYKEINPQLKLLHGKPKCAYDYLLTSSNSISRKDVPEKFNNFVPKGIENGSYVPEQCEPLFSVALLVTYRNRQKQLDLFLPYMHNFLRNQNIHYKIFLIEQQDEGLWNKGLLYNIGAKLAIAEKFPCLILHDVDLLPLVESNLYVCMKHPRHMSASIDKFRYVLPYDNLVGGVLAIRSDHYTMINGFSNRFKGWGGEDDDFSGRLAAHHFQIQRFPRNMTTYTMLVHQQEAKNEARLKIMQENQEIYSKDGLNSIKYSNIQVKQHRLFTLIGVKT